MGKLPSRTRSQISTRAVQVAGLSSGRARGEAEPVPLEATPSWPQRGGSSVKLLRFPAVRERIALSRSTIWRLERRGEFPRHRRISANAVAWVDEEVMEWIRSRT